MVAKIGNCAAHAVLLLVLLWLPLPKAGMIPGALPILMALMALLLVSAWLPSFLFSSPESPLASDLSRSAPWLVFWLIFSILIAWHMWVAPMLGGWSRYFPETSIQETLVSTGATHVNLLNIIKVWGFFSAMWIACWQASRAGRRQVSHILIAILISSAFQAMYGVWHLLSHSTSVLGLWDKLFYLGDATGTFVNRNHYANMLAVSWPLVLSGLLSAEPLVLNKQPLVYRSLVAAIYSIVVALALVNSHSRMGTFAAFVGLVVWAGLHLRSHSQKRSVHSNRWVPYSLIGVAAVFAVWYGVEDMLARYLELGDGNSRLSIWRALFELPLSGWLLGIGPGAFEDVFSLVQPTDLANKFVYAHNDYLELALEFGLIATGILILAAVFWLANCFPRGDMQLRAGAAGSVVAMLIHSQVDFSAQIPASALYFWVSLGLLMNPKLIQVEKPHVVGSNREFRPNRGRARNRGTR